MVGLEGALDRPDADLRSAIHDALSRGELAAQTFKTGVLNLSYAPAED